MCIIDRLASYTPNSLLGIIVSVLKSLGFLGQLLVHIIVHPGDLCAVSSWNPSPTVNTEVSLLNAWFHKFHDFISVGWSNWRSIIFGPKVKGWTCTRHRVSNPRFSQHPLLIFRVLNYTPSSLLGIIVFVLKSLGFLADSLSTSLFIQSTSLWLRSIDAPVWVLRNSTSLLNTWRSCIRLVCFWRSSKI